MTSKSIGALGEKIAESYLKQKNYKILDKNFVFNIQGGPQLGEIDIIAKKDDVISFVEVKTLRQAQGKLLRLRPGQTFLQNQETNFLPEDKVNLAKRIKIMKTAEYWLNKNRIPLDSKWQICVISITIKQDNKAEVKFLRV